MLGAWQAANSLGQLLPALAVPAYDIIGTQASLVGCGVLLAAVGSAARVAHRRTAVLAPAPVMLSDAR